MKFFPWVAIAAGLVASGPAFSQQVIKVDGSSTVFPIRSPRRWRRISRRLSVAGCG